MKAVYSIGFISVFVFILSGRINGQENFQPSVRSKGMVEITVGLTGPWSVFGNQAGLISIHSPSTGISYSNFFMLKELSLKSAFIAFPVDKNVLACSFFRFGNRHYNETKMGIAYAKELFPEFSAGLQFNYFFIHFPENDKNQGTFSFEGGIQYRIHEKIGLAAHFYNPFSVGIKTETVEYKLPSIIRIGGDLALSGGIQTFIEFEKDLENPLVTKIGVEYPVLEKVILRAGVAGKPTVWSIGVGYLYKQLMCDFAWSFHPYLGSTPSVSFSYSIK